MRVLELEPTKAFGDRLDPQGLIQTNARTSGLALRVDGQEKTLIVSDLGAGIRVYGKP